MGSEWGYRLYWGRERDTSVSKPTLKGKTTLPSYVVLYGGERMETRLFVVLSFYW